MKLWVSKEMNARFKKCDVLSSTYYELCSLSFMIKLFFGFEKLNMF